MMSNGMTGSFAVEWLVAALASLLEAGIRGVPLIGLVLLVAYGLRGASAATRASLLRAGMFVLLLLPLAAALPWQLPVLPAVLQAPTVVWPAGPAPASLLDPTDLAADPSRTVSAPALQFSDPTSAASEQRTEMFTRGQAEAQLPPTGSSGDRSWMVWLVAIWFAGLVLLAGRMIASQLVASRLLRRAEPVTDRSWEALLWESADRLEVGVDVRLLQSPAARMPFAIGVVKPAVVLPSNAAEWEEDRRRAVLMHELAHVRRSDLLTHHLARLACLVHWFNPLVWYAARRLRAESERAADDLVLSVGTLPSAYADHLLQILAGASRVSVPAPVLPLARRREFEGRILAILEPHLSRAQTSRAHSFVLTAIVLVAAVPLAALTPAEVGDPSASLRAAVEDAITEAPLAASALEAAPDLVSEDAFPRQEQSAGGLPAALAAESAAEAREEGSANASAAASASTGRSLVFDDRARTDLPISRSTNPGREFARLMESIGELAGVRLEALSASIEALEDLEDPRAIAALIGLLSSDPVPEVRAAAARALGEMDAVDAVPALVAALGGDGDPRVRAVSAWALGKLEDDRAADALIAALDDNDASVRRAAISALGDLESSLTAPGFVRLLSDADPEVRIMAAWSLGDIDLERAPPELLAALRDGDPGVRIAAAAALGEIRDPSAIEALTDALADANVDVRNAALFALAELDSPAALSGLTAALADQNATIRALAARAIGDLDISRAPQELLSALRDADENVRFSAAVALADIEDPLSAQALGDALADASERVRAAVIEALIDLESPVAIEYLIRMLNDPNPDVRRRAAAALSDL